MANGLCCCFSQTASMTRSAFAKSIKMSYIGLSMTFCIFLLIATSYGDTLVRFFAKFVNCPTQDADDLSMCLGISLIVRVSLALLILHLLIGILLYTRDGFAKFLNEECFPFKFIVTLAIVFLLMFVNNSYLDFYVSVSRYLAGIFLFY